MSIELDPPISGPDGKPRQRKVRAASGKTKDEGNGLTEAALAPPKFRLIINPADWEGLPVPPRESIVQEYIPHKTVTLLSGDGSIGKSLLALQLAAARAIAREWIGLLPEPGRTLILSAEDDTDEMHRRLEDIRKFCGVRMADLADIRLVDLVGEDSILGSLMKGQLNNYRLAPVGSCS